MTFTAAGSAALDEASARWLSELRPSRPTREPAARRLHAMLASTIFIAESPANGGAPASSSYSVAPRLHA